MGLQPDTTCLPSCQIWQQSSKSKLPTQKHCAKAHLFRACSCFSTCQDGSLSQQLQCGVGCLGLGGHAHHGQHSDAKRKFHGYWVCVCMLLWVPSAVLLLGCSAVAKGQTARLQQLNGGNWVSEAGAML
jgi:hypothetical protein